MSEFYFDYAYNFKCSIYLSISFTFLFIVFILIGFSYYDMFFAFIFAIMSVTINFAFRSSCYFIDDILPDSPSFFCFIFSPFS